MTTVNGVFYRPKATDMATPCKDPTVRPAKAGQAPASTLAILAAKCNQVGYHVCCGRYAKVGNKTAAADDPELLAYLAPLGTDNTTQGTSVNGLSPRMVIGKSVIFDGNGGGDIRGSIVWGEDCSAKQHFDCIAFVNYCYISVVKNYGQFEIYHWDNGTCNAFPIPASGPALLPADVLIRYTKVGGVVQTKTEQNGTTHNVCDHIGLLDAVNNKVVQAQMSSTGVHTDETYVPSRWDAIRRVPCNLLIPN